MEGNTLATSLQSLVTAITSAFSTSDLLSIVTVAITAVAGYVVLWFGIRFIIRKLRSGIFRGKLG